MKRIVARASALVLSVALLAMPRLVAAENINSGPPTVTAAQAGATVDDVHVETYGVL
jgi:hypothetical protein